MRVTSIGLAAALMLGWFAGPLAAQQQPAAPAPATQPSAAIDASKLPLDLSRLHQKLKASTEKSDRAWLHFNVDVVGQTPRIQLFRPEDDLRYGPTPWSSPTHKEMIEMATPREFRSPVMDFSNLMRWVQSTLKRPD